MSATAKNPQDLGPEAGSTLTKNSVGLSGVLGQSLSAMGLTGVAATSVPIVAIKVGVYSWMVWAIATAVILLVALAIAYLSRRFATTGGLYGLTAATIGPYGALLTGWLMVIMFGIGNGGATLSSGVYLGNFLEQLGIPYNRLTLIICSFAVLVTCWYFIQSGAKLAARVMFATQIVTITAVLILFVIVIVRQPEQAVDTAATNMGALPWGSVLAAVVLSVGAFTGFESASVYGREATRPKRTIPIAMVLSVLIAGAMWMISSQVLMIGFEQNVDNLSNAAAPLSVLAENLGFGWYGAILDLAIGFTIAALVMATLSWLSRMMLTMSRENVAPAAWRHIDPNHHTPKKALRLIFIVWVVEVLVMGSISDQPLDVFGAFLDTLTGLPALLVYALVSGAAVVYHWKSRRRIGAVTLAGVLGVIAMLYVLYSNVNPWPPFPGNLVVILFGLSVISITGYYFWLRKNRPEVISNIGSSVETDTLAVETA